MTTLFCGRLVRLAGHRDDDADAIASWSEDAEFMRLVDTDAAFPRTIEAVRENEKSGGREPGAMEFRLRTLTEDRLIGFVALHSIEWNNRAALLAIGIGDPDYRNRGYGSDALRLILNYAFNELNLDRVGLDVISYNAPAIRAYEKAGFIREGAMRGAVLRDGHRYDRIIMGILREEWQP